MALVSTVGAIQAEIAIKLNQVSADNGDKYLNWINNGMDDLHSDFPRAPWLEVSSVFSLAADSRTYQTSAIDSALLHIYDIRISAQNAKPVYVPRDIFDAADPQPDDTGVPTMYTIFNDEITFYPTPNQAFGAQVNYVAGTTIVSAASAVPSISRRYLEGIVLYGWIQGLYEREDYDQAAVIEQKYQSFKNKIKQELKRRVHESSRMISVRELQTVNRAYNDEITNMFFNS